MVNGFGTQTLEAIAIAGPDLQVRMLQAFGLKSTLITDGSNPIDLLETAEGLICVIQPYKNFLYFLFFIKNQKIDEYNDYL
jgi:major vault protein